MTTHPNQSTLVSKLTLIVLVLILGCLGALVYKAFQEPPTVTQADTAVVVEPVQEVPPATPPQSNQLVSRVVPPVRPKTPVLLVQPTTPPAVAKTPPVPPPPPIAATSPWPPPPSVPLPLPPVGPIEGVAATASLRYVAQPVGSEMRIEGDSTAHKWACVSKIISGQFIVEPAWQSDPTLKTVTCLGKGQTPPLCNMHIPVAALKSQEQGSGASVMDRRLQALMNARRYRTIDYELTELEAIREESSPEIPVAFKATGRLAIGGVTNQVVFPVTMERPGAERLVFNGVYRLKMSDYGIRPPEFNILGVGRWTADEVVLKWKWSLALAAETAAR